jgi:branched-chain amino acid transport system permease protein
MLPFVVTGVALGSLYALSGVGMVLLFRATGVLNLAYGAVGALGVLVAWELNQHRGVAFWPSLLVCLLVTTGLSLAWGGIVGPWLAERDPVVKATATLGLALACLGVCNWYWLDKARTLALPSDEHVYGVADVQVSATQTAALVLAVVVTALASWLLRVTVTGTTMRALANDRELASMLGVRVRRAEILAWLISGLLAGVSAIYLADLTVLSANNLTFLVIPALAAAVIGRLTSLWGTLLGGIVVGIAEGLLTQYSELAQIRSTVPFLVAIAVQLWLARRKTYTLRTAEDRA